MWDWKDPMLGNCESEIVPSSFSMMAWRKEFCPSADDRDYKEVDFFAFDKVVCLARRNFLHIWSCSWVFSMINWSKIDFPLNLPTALCFFLVLGLVVIMNTKLSLLLTLLLGLRRSVMDSSVFCFCCSQFHGCEMQAHFCSHYYFLVWKNGWWILLCFASNGMFCHEKLTFAHFIWFESWITKIDLAHSGLEYM